MNSLRSWLNHRRETIRKAPWLRPTMLLVDLIFVVIVTYVSPAIGVAIGLLGIVLNEMLSPLIVRHIHHKELHATERGVASLDTKVIRAERPGSGTAQQGAQADGPASGGPAA